jgi:hypothetical protein
LSCEICHHRKDKRFCLALHGRICPQCCGEQREVTLDCPSECPYLQQARQHEKPRRFQDLPADEMFPKIEVPETFLHEQEHLIAGLMGTVAGVTASDRSLKDTQVLAALANAAQSYQTLVDSGLLYAEALPGPGQQAIVDALRQAVQEFRELEQKHRGHTALRDSDVLMAIVFVLRLGHAYTTGRPLSRAFVDFLKQRFPSSQSAIAGADAPSGRIILP